MGAADVISEQFWKMADVIQKYNIIDILYENPLKVSKLYYILACLSPCSHFAVKAKIRAESYSGIRCNQFKSFKGLENLYPACLN